jgi:hypothetical protein
MICASMSAEAFFKIFIATVFGFQNIRDHRQKMKEPRQNHLGEGYYY